MSTGNERVYWNKLEDERDRLLAKGDHMTASDKTRVDQINKKFRDERRSKIFGTAVGVILGAVYIVANELATEKGQRAIRNYKQRREDAAFNREVEKYMKERAAKKAAKKKK